MKDRIAAYLKTADLSRCTRADIAEHLGIPNSTLGRHLMEGGTTFTELLNGERIRRLENLNDMKPKQIGYELGFMETNSFYRWYQGTMGRSISGREVAQ